MPRSDTPRRTFVLQRDQDISGVSGLGEVAEDVQFGDGTVVLRWRGTHASTVVWDSLRSALAIHGHDGATRVVWDDVPRDEQDAFAEWGPA